MEDTKRPFQYIKKEEVNLSTYEKIILFLAILLVSWVLWFCFNASPLKSQALIPKDNQIAYTCLLKKHGLLGKIAVIEIHQDGSLWFERAGKRCRFQ